MAIGVLYIIAALIIISLTITAWGLSIMAGKEDEETNGAQVAVGLLISSAGASLLVFVCTVVIAFIGVYLPVILMLGCFCILVHLLFPTVFFMDTMRTVHSR